MVGHPHRDGRPTVADGGDILARFDHDLSDSVGHDDLAGAYLAANAWRKRLDIPAELGNLRLEGDGRVPWT